jgi:hypothetical protein
MRGRGVVMQALELSCVNCCATGWIGGYSHERSFVRSSKPMHELSRQSKVS